MESHLVAYGKRHEDIFLTKTGPVSVVVRDLCEVEVNRGR